MQTNNCLTPPCAASSLHPVSVSVLELVLMTGFYFIAPRTTDVGGLSVHSASFTSLSRFSEGKTLKIGNLLLVTILYLKELYLIAEGR